MSKTIELSVLLQRKSSFITDKEVFISSVFAKSDLEQRYTDYVRYMASVDEQCTPLSDFIKRYITITVPVRTGAMPFIEQDVVQELVRKGYVFVIAGQNGQKYLEMQRKLREHLVKTRDF